MLFFEDVWLLSYDLLSFLGVEINLRIIFDIYSLVFFFTVILISFVIFFYRQYYIDGENSLLKFFILLRGFVMSIVFLIFSPNFVFLLLGWDGLGVTSYLLVIYYLNYKSSVAGILTFLVNRLGDIFFFVSLSFFFFFINWNFFETKYSYFFIAIVITITFITKRAQIPFSSWLPAAIAAPTPVSSLVHSSTLVTAGVYLFVRFSFITYQSTMFWLTLLSSFTIILAGVMANYDWDLKKVVAFSTLRQLGFMLVSYRLGIVVFCFFHLLTHAFFKASLFMCSGFIIHSSDSRQDFRNGGTYLLLAPFLSFSVFICLLCLCGFPFSSGFYSKDLVLDGRIRAILVFLSFYVGVLITFVYSFRYAKYIFNVRGLSRIKICVVSESIVYVIISVSFLLIVSIVFGAVYAESIDSLLIFIIVRRGWKITYWSRVLFTLIACQFNFFFFFRKYFFSKMWFLSILLRSFTLSLSFKFSKLLLSNIDQGWLEVSGPNYILKGLSLWGYLLVISVFYLLTSLVFFFFVVVW